MKTDTELCEMPEISSDRIEPIADGKVQAVVRRNLGRVYGSEFLSLTAADAANYRKL
jgi:hypothetical protein